jgi:hypothetical protein
MNLFGQNISPTFSDVFLHKYLEERGPPPGANPVQLQRRQPGVCVSECLSIERATACTTASCACGFLNRVSMEYIDNCANCLLTVDEADAVLLPVLANMCLCSNGCLSIINALLAAYYCSTNACACTSVNSPGSANWTSCVSCVESENPLNATALFNIEQQCASTSTSIPPPSTPTTTFSAQPNTEIQSTAGSTSNGSPATIGVSRSGVQRAGVGTGCTSMILLGLLGTFFVQNIY